jgi:tetratricopeptide (TPR) repeat protein
LKGAIAWSYDLLDDPHRKLFSRFSVFARGASLEQAETVCAGPATELGVDVLTGLDELADQSLLRRLPDYDEPRLLMLQVIREYAFDMLQASGEADEIRERHAEAMQRLAESAAPHLFGSEQKKWLDRLELDHDNFRAAFDWSVSHGDAQRALSLGAVFWRFWQFRGHLREGRMRLDTILEMPGSRDEPANRARALEAAGGVAYWQGDMDGAQVYYDEALELARARGDPAGIANALYNASFPRNVGLKELPKAQALLEEALPIFQELGNERGYAQILWGLGQIYFRGGHDTAASKKAMDEAIVLFRRLDDRFGLGWALFTRALLALRMNDIASSKAYNLEALKLFAGGDDVTAPALILRALSEAAHREGDEIRAARLAGAAEAQEAASGSGLGSIVGGTEGWRPPDELSPAEAAARAEGKAMTLEDAIAYALAESDEASAIA